MTSLTGTISLFAGMVGRDKKRKKNGGEGRGGLMKGKGKLKSIYFPHIIKLEGRKISGEQGFVKYTSGLRQLN